MHSLSLSDTRPTSWGEVKHRQGLNHPTSDLNLFPTQSLTREALPTRNWTWNICHLLSILVVIHTTRLDSRSYNNGYCISYQIFHIKNDKHCYVITDTVFHVITDSFLSHLFTLFLGYTAEWIPSVWNSQNNWFFRLIPIFFIINIYSNLSQSMITWLCSLKILDLIV